MASEETRLAAAAVVGAAAAAGDVCQAGTSGGACPVKSSASSAVAHVFPFLLLFFARSLSGVHLHVQVITVQITCCVEMTLKNK